MSTSGPNYFGCRNSRIYPVGTCTTPWRGFMNGLRAFEALIPLATSVVYLGTHLTLEGAGKAVAQHRLAKARDREAKIKRTVQARRLLGLQHRIRIWQTCSVTSALFGIHPIGLSSTGAVVLRQWFHRQLRAIPMNQLRSITSASPPFAKSMASRTQLIISILRPVARLEKYQPTRDDRVLEGDL